MLAKDMYILCMHLLRHRNRCLSLGQQSLERIRLPSINRDSCHSCDTKEKALQYNLKDIDSHLEERNFLIEKKHSRMCAGGHYAPNMRLRKSELESCGTDAGRNSQPLKSVE